MKIYNVMRSEGGDEYYQGSYSTKQKAHDFISNIGFCEELFDDICLDDPRNYFIKEYIVNKGWYED